MGVVLSACVERVKKIQNKAQSLRWGSHYDENVGHIIVCGHTSYRGRILTFRVTDEGVCVLTEDNSVVDMMDIVDDQTVIDYVTEKLREYYPGGVVHAT